MGRPANGVKGETVRKKTACGNLYTTDNTGSDYKEVFLRLGKPGGCAQAFLQALAIAMSLGIRAGVPKEKFIEKFKEIRCPTPMWSDGVQILSCPDAIARALEEGVGDED